MSSLDDKLGPALKELRLRKRLTQAEVAERAGIGAPQVQRYEAGKAQPYISTIGKLLSAMDATLWDLTELMMEEPRSLRPVAPPVFQAVAAISEEEWSGIGQELEQIAVELLRAKLRALAVKLAEEEQTPHE
jgi:transcriptional regulator with XRE-family HTH domain